MNVISHFLNLFMVNSHLIFQENNDHFMTHSIMSEPLNDGFSTDTFGGKKSLLEILGGVQH